MGSEGLGGAVGRAVCVLMVLVLALGRSAAAQQVKVLEDFEQAQSALDEPVGEVVNEHTTNGTNALRVESGRALVSSRFDFTGARDYDWLAFDIFNPQDEPRSLLVVIRDSIGMKGGYWARYNGYLTLRPGMNHIRLPINNLYRGEKGSQPMKAKGPIVAEDIRMVSIVPGYGDKSPGVFYVDYIRLEKEAPVTEVPGLRAFDFGPLTQTVFPGFTPVTYNTTYTRERGFGLRRAQWKGAARDDLSPNSLYSDYCELRDNPFSVDLPNGLYTVMVVYDDTGFWEGEFRPFHRRSIQAEGKTVYEERYTDEEALARYFHFQDTEPLPGDDIYGTYIGYRFAPKVFEAEVADGQLNLTFQADTDWASKVAAVIIYPTKYRRRADEWLSWLERRLRQEFDDLWVYVPPRNPHAGVGLPAEAARKGYLLFVPPLEAEVNFAYTPTEEELKSEVAVAAARGEYEPILVGLRPLRDLGPVRVEVSDLVSDEGRIPAEAVQVMVVRNLTRRLGSSRFTIAPALLRPFDTVDLKKDLTREFWLTVGVPTDAEPGLYRGKVTFTFADGRTDEVAVRLTVHPFTLREADFTFGLFWVRPNLGGVYGPETERYWKTQEAVLRMLREHGFTSLTGPPMPRITGVKAGEVVLDYTDFDRFWKMALKVGFHRDYQSYGRGIAGLNPETAKKFGITYEQLIRSTFRQLREHSQAVGAPPFTVSLCDEPRTPEQFQALFRTLPIWRRAAPEVMAGYFSLTKERLADPKDPHKRIFDLLTVPILNRHDAEVLRYARRQGKRVDIYNQGTSRFSFGLYQWREKLAGVGGRWQWIMNIAYADPYYDLDGREPDPCFIYFRTDGLAPAVRLEVAREGIDDLRYITTAVALAEKARSSGDAQARDAAHRALARIEEVMGKLQVGRRRTQAVDLDEFRRALARDIAQMALGLRSE